MGGRTSIKVSKDVEECLIYALKPRNNGQRINTTWLLIGKMFLFLWLLCHCESVIAYIDFCPTAVGVIIEA